MPVNNVHQRADVIEDLTADRSPSAAGAHRSLRGRSLPTRRSVGGPRTRRSVHRETTTTTTRWQSVYARWPRRCSRSSVPLDPYGVDGRLSRPRGLPGESIHHRRTAASTRCSISSQAEWNCVEVYRPEVLIFVCIFAAFTFTSSHCLQNK